jgi:hypothetical protein
MLEDQAFSIMNAGTKKWCRCFLVSHGNGIFHPGTHLSLTTTVCCCDCVTWASTEMSTWTSRRRWMCKGEGEGRSHRGKVTHYTNAMLPSVLDKELSIIYSKPFFLSLFCRRGQEIQVKEMTVA